MEIRERSEREVMEKGQGDRRERNRWKNKEKHNRETDRENKAIKREDGNEREDIRRIE